MPEPFKNRYNRAFFQHFASTLVKLDPGFDIQRMEDLTFTSDWDSLELKARSKRLAYAFHLGLLK